MVRIQQEGQVVAKELKVKLPMDQHLKLHTLKVLKGQSISNTVETALVRYFDRMGMQREEHSPVLQALGYPVAQE